MKGNNRNIGGKWRRRRHRIAWRKAASAISGENEENGENQQQCGEKSICGENMASENRRNKAENREKVAKKTMK
jgi:hypothetical protein